MSPTGKHGGDDDEGIGHGDGEADGDDGDESEDDAVAKEWPDDAHAERETVAELEEQHHHKDDGQVDGKVDDETETVAIQRREKVNGRDDDVEGHQRRCTKAHGHEPHSQKLQSSHPTTRKRQQRKSKKRWSMRKGRKVGETKKRIGGPCPWECRRNHRPLGAGGRLGGDHSRNRRRGPSLSEERALVAFVGGGRSNENENEIERKTKKSKKRKNQKEKRNEDV